VIGYAFMRYLSLRLLQVFMVSAGLLSTEVLADDPQRPSADPGAVNLILTADSPQVTRVGSFRVVSGYLSRSAKVYRSTSDRAQVRYAPKLPLNGSYEVHAWWPQVTMGAGPVEATVYDAKGRTQLQLDQGSRGGQWNLLGVFEAAAGKPLIVSLKAPEGRAVIADALRFNRLGRKPPALEIEPERLPPGEVNVDYRTELSANGRPPLAWALAAGQPPDGIVLDAATGTISGRAADAGPSEFTVEVRDATGRRTQREMRLEMMEAEVSQ